MVDARKAAELERDKQLIDAAELWDQASRKAIIPKNADWAVKRAMHCRQSEKRGWGHAWSG
jgi:hypothetical protein